MGFIAAGAAEAATVTIPVGHQAGDLLVIFGFRDGSTTSPSVPTGWTSRGANAGTACASVLGSKVAGSSSETSGTWTNANELVCYVFRNQATNKTPIIAPSAQTGTGTTISYSALSPMQCAGTSYVLSFAGHTSVDTALETPPTGMTFRGGIAGVTAEVAVFDTANPVNAWSFLSVNAGGTSGNWITKTVEILVEQMNIENYKFVNVGDGMSTGERII